MSRFSRWRPRRSGIQIAESRSRDISRNWQRRFAAAGEAVCSGWRDCDSRDGNLSFDDLLMRIHPAESRVAKLSKETPVRLYRFRSCWWTQRRTITGERPLDERRKALERFAKTYLSPETDTIRLSPVTDRHCRRAQMVPHGRGAGRDRRQTRRSALPNRRAHRHGENQEAAHGRLRGGRISLSGKGTSGRLAVVGFIQRRRAPGSCGIHFVHSPGGSRGSDQELEGHDQAAGVHGQSAGRPEPMEHETFMEWEPLEPKLVVEVQFDHFTGGRFRHGTKFLRWRPEKAPSDCTMKQVKRENRSAFRAALKRGPRPIC